MPEQYMTDDEFLYARRAMNVGQKDVFLFITRSISEQLSNQSDERLRLFMTGKAGTGKTFPFNLLKNQESYRPSSWRGQMYDTDISSVRIDFGKDCVHLIQPKTEKFPANYSHGTPERRMLPIILYWTCKVYKMQGIIVDHAIVYLGSKLLVKHKWP
ncbi:ATP-dependent DNA helicase [Trichonephila clavata]|uniref:ATP-dependent DNA helicase n=1 Tax=Trichonephila clavata TaxID=2740835 RepID=A0A8X6KEM1_TRICU|nr:ATP-dependent DNA helicase [Trichonephila clavata]